MTKTKRKLFGIFNRNSSFRASSISENDNWLVIPERKTQNDLLPLFEQSLKESNYLKNSVPSFDAYSVGYMFSIDRLLNVYRIIRMKYHQMVFTVKIEDPKNVTMEHKSREYLQKLFEKTFSISSSMYDNELNYYTDEIIQGQFLSFIYGYNKAKENAISICDIVESDYYKNNRTFEYSIYAVWDYLSSELISLNKENNLVKNFVDETQ